MEIKYKDSVKVRKSNMELCRIVAMILVIIVHSDFGFAEACPTGLADVNIPLLSLEAFSIIGVNLFILITGYFGLRPNVKSLSNLLYICLFYAAFRIFIGACTGYINIKDLFFVSNSNWFIPSYLGLMLLAPFLNSLIDSRKQLCGGGYSSYLSTKVGLVGSPR